MLRDRFNRIRAQESGFTLTELLVVILIIGILAAIALPNFLDQRTKAQDTDAKSNARNLAGQLELCFTDSGSYVGAGDGGSCVSDDTGLPLGKHAGEVRVTAVSDNSYTVAAKSAAGDTLKIVKNGDKGTVKRKCSGTGCTSNNW